VTANPPAGMAELCHGYTLADLHRLSRMSAAANRTMAADHRDLLDIAWSAIAEALYAAENWPSEHHLLRVGKGAIWELVRDHRQTYGYRDREWDAGLGTAPRFCAYWFGATVTPSPEEPIVEREALPRILAALTDRQRQALSTVAAWNGDRVQAAAALGVTEAALNHQLRMARRTCLALWLEHETPRRVPLRRLDRRNHRGEVAPCGTMSAVFRHRHRGERLCGACAPLEVEYDRERKARRKAVASG
jgi:hypothetical protein